MNKLLLCLLAHCSFLLGGAQVTFDSVQIERIAKTCELWGHLKYFHPYLSDRSFSWESAFTKNIGSVIAAESRKEFGVAIQEMLSYLNDSAIRVVAHPIISRSEDSLKYPTVEFIQDSILLISIRNYKDLNDFPYAKSQFLALKKEMPRAKGIIFDIRNQDYLSEMRGYLSWLFTDIEGDLANEEVQLPGLRARFHDGFSPETGSTSGGYFSGYFIKGQNTIDPSPRAIDKPIVFVVNDNSEVPMIALGLQRAKRAHIISATTLTDASVVEILNFQLEDSLEVSLRLNDLPPDVFFKVDYIVPADSQLIDLAVHLIGGQEFDEFRLPKKQNNSSPQEQEEAERSNTSFPDLEERLLAAAKIWTVIHYFFAYQDLMENDWDEILRAFIPRFANASNSLEYALVVAEMYTNIEDGHGFIRSKVLDDFFGQAPPPVQVRFIEDEPVVVGIVPDSICKVRGLDIGDVILEVDGEKVNDRFDLYAKYISTSNQAWLKNMVAGRLLNGEDATEAILKIRNADGTAQVVSLARKRSYSQHLSELGRGRNDQPITRLVTEDIGYVDLDRLTVDMVDQMFSDFRKTKGIIFDMRGYPNGTAWSIAPYLADEEDVDAARFRRYSPMGIDLGTSKHMTFFNQQLPPRKTPTYSGKTIMLIDERTISQAEHTGLFLKAANGTVFIGSQTAGANGDVTNFKIPGDILLMFSGHDVRYADGSQLQKVGLIPDVLVKPTIEGIRNGEDEVLDRAQEYLENLLRKGDR